MKNSINILVMNLKGGAGKSTTSGIAASYLSDATLIEIDKINKTANRIKSEGYFKSIQVDFKNADSDEFLDFENSLHQDGIRVIDIGAIMLETFNVAMMCSGGYGEIDLIIIPAMDGKDDFDVAVKFLATLKDVVPSEKIMFAFSRFNSHEYSSVFEQFDTFFDNKKILKKDYGIDLENEDTYFTLQDNRGVKIASRLGVPIRSIADRDLTEINAKQKSTKDNEERLVFTKERSLINKVQNFEQDFILPMMEKIVKKIEPVKVKEAV